VADLTERGVKGELTKGKAVTLITPPDILPSSSE